MKPELIKKTLVEEKIPVHCKKGHDFEIMPRLYLFFIKPKESFLVCRRCGLLKRIENGTVKS